MLKLQLVAIGNSKDEAEEIVSIVNSFLVSLLPIKKITPASLIVKDECIYVAPSGVERKLSRIPPSRRYFFDMHPTEDFFASIRKIPLYYPIYVFNGRFSYIKLLMKECKRRGIYHNFFPIAFLDQPKSDVELLLKRAEYIVGIDRKMGTQALFSEEYRYFLRGNVKIITGRRAASAASAGKLLAGIASYYETAMKTELETIKEMHLGGEDVEISSNVLFNRIFEVAVQLANAKYRINANEGKNSYDDELFLEDDGLELTGEPERDFRKIEARILDFELLRQRIQMLTRGL